jgi:hypothetical protein
VVLREHCKDKENNMRVNQIDQVTINVKNLEEIASVARRHSQDMATGRAGVGHQGVDERRDSLFRVISFKGL